MLVAQRSRELALLRALGASRRQVNRAVILEAAVVGVIGSTIGLGLGVLLSIGLQQLIGLFLGDLPTDGLVFQSSTVLWAYLTGVVVTVVSAIAPARRATHIPPVAALRDDVALPESSLRRRALVGTAMLGRRHRRHGRRAGGRRRASCGSVSGRSASSSASAMLSPFLSRPVVGGVGSLLPRVWGPTGRLARENARRNPRRTAATASALMIGLALVSAGGVLAASIVKSANGIIDRSVGADFIVTADNFMPIPSDVADEVRPVDGVDAVTSFRSRPGAGRRRASCPCRASPPTRSTGRCGSTVVTGDIGALATRTTMLVDEDVAKDKGWKVGDAGARRPSARPATTDLDGRRHLRRRTRSPATT